MFRILFIVFIILFSDINYSCSQGINENWIMGYGSNISHRNIVNFNNGVFSTNYYSFPMQYRYTNTTISDSTGNLLFSTNGYYIADATGDTMLNGSGLNPSAYTDMFTDGLSISQANFAIPMPGNDSIYYLFHSTIDLLATTDCMFLYLSTININSNGGLGAVISKNQVLLNDNLNIGKITGCKHANGRDWWVFCHKENSNTYYSFLVSPYGIDGPFTQAIGINRAHDAGQMSFSPDGSKFAIYWPIEDLEIFDFDRCTGMLSNPIHVIINDSASTGGVAFSSNSEVLYVTSTKYVYQFDLTSSNIPSTKTTVAAWDGFYSPAPPLATLFVLAQLAPDGKIYISTGNSTLHLHVINQPGFLGVDCDFIQHGIPLNHYYFNTLPNHPNYFLSNLSGSPCDSLTSLPSIHTSKLNAWPNPTASNINLTMEPNSSSGQLQIIDQLGKVTLSEFIPPWIQTKSIDLFLFPSGIYHVQINWPNKKSSKRIIKQ